MNSEDSARNGTAEFTALGHEIFTQGWQLLADYARLQAQTASTAAEGTEPADAKSAFEALTRHIETTLTQLQQQRLPLASLLELVNAASAQLNLLQGLTAGMQGTSGNWGKLFRLPQIGPLQQRQQRLEAAAAAAQEYFAAQQEQLTLLRQLTERTLVATRARLDQGEPRTLRELYDLWLESAEAVYEEFIAGEEYARSLARLGNSATTLMQHTQDGLEDLLNVLRLPTRADLLSTQRRLHDIRRRQHSLAEQIDPEEFQALRDEVAQLRRELAALKESCSETAKAGKSDPEPSG